MLTLAARGKELALLLFFASLRAALWDSNETLPVPIRVSILNLMVSENVSLLLNPEQTP